MTLGGTGSPATSGLSRCLCRYLGDRRAIDPGIWNEHIRRCDRDINRLHVARRAGGEGKEDDLEHYGETFDGSAERPFFESRGRRICAGDRRSVRPSVRWQCVGGTGSDSHCLPSISTNVGATGPSSGAMDRSKLRKIARRQ